MSLAPGVRLHGYEIVALLGAGGMGEVYRALDTRLNREVALKILPPAMAGDASAYARFEREAQAVAALSHPNILAVHDVGRADTATYAVFELLGGASLRERLSQGPLPLRKAIDYARQVADGLAAAHARGITHRDIKPDNLFVTDDGRVKIVDFGLARAVPSGSPADAVTGATTAAPITGEGTVLGTAGYMAPEQVRGQAADHRADLFALGATLYEMCTGRRAFKGATPADTMSAVLTSDPPDIASSGQSVPPALERIVRRCLEKQPAERFQSARDLAFALDALSTLSGPAVSAPAMAPAWRPWRLAAVSAAVAAALGVAAGRAVRPAPPEPSAAPSLRAELPLAAGPVGRLLPSPDGRFLLTMERTAEALQVEVVLHTLATGESRTVPQSIGGLIGTWSPRSDEFLMMAADGEVRRVRVTDLVATPVARLDGPRRAITWLADDTIVYPPVANSRGLRRVPIGGGAATEVRDGTVVRDGTGDNSPFFWLSRVGTRTDVVLGLLAPGGGERQVVRVDLASGAITPLVSSAFEPTLALGHLFLPRAAGLFAAPFDISRLAVDGEFQRVGDTGAMDAVGSFAAVGVSDAGVLAYRPGRPRSLQFQWIGSTGQTIEPVGEPGSYSGFALSPDGTRVVVRVTASADTMPTAASLRVIDLSRGVTSKVSVPAGPLSDPIWSADGARVYYRLGAALFSQSPLGTTRETIIGSAAYPDHVSPDGRWLIVGRPAEQGGFALSVVAADGTGTPQRLGDGPAVVDEGRFSPDGRFISYQSSQSGRQEIYLARFPLTDERWQLSASGGVQAQWAPDSRAVYYLSPTGRMMQVRLPDGAPDRASRPVELFDTGIGTPSSIFEQYAVHRDRFLVLRPLNDEPPTPVVVVNNWRPTSSGPSGAASTP